MNAHILLAVHIVHVLLLILEGEWQVMRNNISFVVVITTLTNVFIL